MPNDELKPATEQLPSEAAVAGAAPCSANRCNDWTKCPHAKCRRETMSGESWECAVCNENWYVDYDDIR